MIPRRRPRRGGTVWGGAWLAEAREWVKAIDRGDSDPIPDVPGQLPLFPGPDGSEAEGPTRHDSIWGVGCGAVPPPHPTPRNATWGNAGAGFAAPAGADPRSRDENGGGFGADAP